MRISACFLYSDIYEKLDAEQKSMTLKKFQKLSKDDTPMVRRGAAQSIPAIASQIESALAKDFLLPIIKALLEDSNDSVKINAVASSIDVAKSVNDSNLIKETILPSFKTACENRYSWRLRFAVAENAANLCPHINISAIDEEIIGYYELLLRDAEPEVRSEAISKLPIVSKHCSSPILVDKILPILKE
jgi:serine/threonine-protein phosphatase 2A regulatory subunit A